MPTGTLRAALLLALSLFAACKTGVPSAQGKHWGVDSVPQRVVKRFTGYRSDHAGEFIDFQYQKKKHINRTLRRHFALNSPDNPFEAFDPSLTQRRPAHGISPDPIFTYHNAESFALGFVVLGVTGLYVPFPIESAIATLDGNWDEFGRAFVAGGSAEDPPSVSSFRVKNR